MKAYNYECCVIDTNAPTCFVARIEWNSQAKTWLGESHRVMHEAANALCARWNRALDDDCEIAFRIFEKDPLG
jgi:hypothetical protein